ncbi:MAG: hypothetical protein KC777_03710 [Cyanobacteria bacterium HKST-UBA02]|nr:hypothetical protein [Cyanobacteria bacterium HKST-UBA02]
MSDDVRDNKQRSLQYTINATEDELVAMLFDALPETENPEPEQIARVRELMAELFTRGLPMGQFAIQTGLTGFPVDPPQPGMQRHAQHSYGPIYFKHWIVDNDPTQVASAVENILRFRLECLQGMEGYVAQVYVDIDSDMKGAP